MGACESGVMAQTSCVILSPDDRERVASIIADRNRPQKHVQRARIILHSDEHLPVQEVARRAGVSRPAVWRWQQRFAEEGIEGLLRDKTRPPGKAPLRPETVAQVLALTCSEPPGEVTHWTGRAVAQIVGISLKRSSGSGRLIVFSRTGYAPSSARMTLPLPRRWRTSSACT